MIYACLILYPKSAAFYSAQKMANRTRAPIDLQSGGGNTAARSSKGALLIDDMRLLSRERSRDLQSDELLPPAKSSPSREAIKHAVGPVAPSPAFSPRRQCSAWRPSGSQGACEVAQQWPVQRHGYDCLRNDDCSSDSDTCRIVPHVKEGSNVPKRRPARINASKSLCPCLPSGWSLDSRD